MSLTLRRANAPLLLVLSSLLFGLMAFEAKRASTRLPGSEVAFFRFAIGLGCLGVLFGSRLVRPRFHRYGLLFLRGLFGGVAVVCFFTTIAHLDVSIATLLNFTSPVFTAVFGALFLRERVGGRVLGALALTVVGVTLVARAHAHAGTWGIGRWELVGLFGAACAGAAITGVRGLRRADVGPWEIVAALSLLGAACTAPLAAHAMVWPRGREWRLLAEVGLIALLAQWLMNVALGGMSVAVAGTISQITPIATFVLGALFLGEPVTGAAVAGTALTLAGVLAATLPAPRTGTPQPEFLSDSSRDRAVR